MAPSSAHSNAPDTLVVAFGNPLRRDDGAAWQVIHDLPKQPAVATSCVIQLGPELAADVAGFARVIFIDASAGGTLGLTPVLQPHQSAISHSSHPAEIVALAERLYGFKGEAWVCHVPVEDFGAGEGLSDFAKQNVADAVELLSAELQPPR